jgi:eukaryotic-like serine/threonine-protein kinase
MHESVSPITIVRFGSFEVDLHAGELRKRGLKIRLQEQPFRVLAILLEHPGEVVTREELKKRLWPAGTFVDFDQGLNKAINKIREALGDLADNPRFLETLPRRGYRIIAPVDRARADPDSPSQQIVTAGRLPASSGHSLRMPLPIAPDLHAGAVRERPLRSEWTIPAVALLALGLVGLAVEWFVWNGFGTGPELKQRQLTVNSSASPVMSGVISPDAKYLAYADGVGIHLKLVASGEEQKIPQPEEFAYSGTHWSVSSWFPDGTKFLASSSAWLGGAGPRSIWAVSVLGARPHKIRDDAWNGSISPDGSQIAFTTLQGELGDREIWVMGANGEQPHRIFTADKKNEIGRLQWSPEGQRLAYLSYHQTPDQHEISLETRALKGGPVSTVFSKPGLRDYYWLPSGRIICPVDEPPPYQRSSNLWEVRIDSDTGRTTGQPKKLTNWAGFWIQNLSSTADGKHLTFTRQSWHDFTLIAEIEANGTRLKPPLRLTLSEEGMTAIDWTADSKGVLFSSDRNGNFDIFKQGLDQESAEPIVAGPENEFDPRLSPDGLWLLYAIEPKLCPFPPMRSSVPIMRVPVSGGVPQRVFDARGYFYHSCSTRLGDLCVVAERTPDWKQLVFTAFDPIKGRDREVARIDADLPGYFYVWNLSPDGSRVAVLTGKEHQSQIRIFSLPSKSAHDLTVHGWGGFYILNWLSDGTGMIISSKSPQGITLLYVDLKGNAHPLWEHRGSDAYAFESRNGRYLAISASTSNSNLWMIENF